MANGIFAASRERVGTLMAAGCPLDFPEALPGPSFRAEQLAGYAGSCVYAFPSQAVWVIGLRLGTDRPGGIVITEWDVVPPWPTDLVDWDYEPQDTIPKRDLDQYEGLLDSPLMGVLNEHRLLRRGYPVEGLLCGRSWQSIPESGGDRVPVRLTLVDDRGSRVEHRMALIVIRESGTRSPSSRTPRVRVPK